MTQLKRPKTYESASVKNDVESIKTNFINILEQVIGKDEYTATKMDIFKALSYLTKAKMMRQWIKTQQNYHLNNKKRVYYLSFEFLIGRLLEDSILNLGIEDNVKEALKSMNINYKEIIEVEPDAGLGNGGLGRLAACFLDSMATLGIPCHGYGIRYDYGIFKQDIVNGKQVEKPDNWLKNGNPWETERNQYSQKVRFYGQLVHAINEKGDHYSKLTKTYDVVAMPYDTPVPGYGNDTVNTLRLWSSRASDDFNLDYFNEGDYIRSCENSILSENISKILYPNDSSSAGKELRLKQQYFFISASIQDIFRRFKTHNKNMKVFPQKVVIQINDTHPAMAIPEFMRILIDEEKLSWSDAWDITKNTFAYSNHTLLPEALEKWPVDMMTNTLPRLMEIIFEINQNFLTEIRRKYPNEIDLDKRVSIIEEGPVKMIRMAYLATIGSFSVNGVSILHTELLKENLLKDFYFLYPEKFNAKTNGITPRRWLYTINKPLSTLITDKIGSEWIKDLSEIKNLNKLAEDSSFQKKWLDVKKQNKIKLAKYIYDEHGVSVNTDSIFDIQAKRFHEYKRQLLGALHAIHLYNKIKNSDTKDFTPRTIIFSGKAAPAYFFAKLIIKFINNIADQINNDPDTKDLLNVFFLKDYSVSLASKLIPACDLSEQISTAGFEASGTGNMKFSLNGALTIGTLDGANIEIMEEVGRENIYIFGLKAHEVSDLRSKGYNPKEIYDNNLHIRTILDMIKNNYFSPDEPGIFQPIYDKLLNEGDYYMHLADFKTYVETQELVAQEFQNKQLWAKKSILNVANMGKFSSDRTIMDYANHIWKVKPEPIESEQV